MLDPRGVLGGRYDRGGYEHAGAATGPEQGSDQGRPKRHLEGFFCETVLPLGSEFTNGWCSLPQCFLNSARAKRDVPVPTAISLRLRCGATFPSLFTRLEAALSINGNASTGGSGWGPDQWRRVDLASPTIDPPGWAVEPSAIHSHR